MLKLLRGERTLAQTQKALFVVALLAVMLMVASFTSSVLLLQRQISSNHRTIRQSCRLTFRILTELIAASADHKHLTLAQKKDLVQYESLVDPRRCDKDAK